METFEKVNQYLGTTYKSNEEIDWLWISKCQHLSEDFIREFQDKVNWYYISKYQHLSENFIRDFQENVYWSGISKRQHLSEDFIREFKDKVTWWCISKHQNLSEDFIREFKDDVNWHWVSKYQRLSEDFISEFKDNVDWYNISMYQKLSKDFIREFKNKLNISLLKTSWLYKDTAFKKKQVEKTGLYECHEDYFIAYKGIRSDRYSSYNFQFKYEKDKTYETWCDCSDTENSFGFSVWTEEKAKEYCNELIVRVKIKYEDVGRVVHDGGKIRCFKIEILD